MEKGDPDLDIRKLGECRITSPLSSVQFVNDEEHVLYHSNLRKIEALLQEGRRPPCFEMAGPSQKIYFDPSKLKCGIVTCSGLCPGLNDVIRAVILSLFYHYGVQTVFGLRYGFESLSPKYRHTPIELNPKVVSNIHQKGGTILGSSRGLQDISEMVDILEQMNVGILLTMGGDGTLRGAQAIAAEVERRGLKIGVIGIPRTIDSDISHVQQSFGFGTAVTESRAAIYGANMEATGARNGIGLVKLMGRHSGFNAAFATLANSDVNFCLVPEVPFTLEGFLEGMRDRLEKKSHPVVG